METREPARRHGVMEVYLTDAGKAFQEHQPQGIVWEYDVDRPFNLEIY